MTSKKLKKVEEAAPNAESNEGSGSDSSSDEDMDPAGPNEVNN